MTDRRYRGWKYGKNITFRAVLTIRISVIHTTGQRTVKDLKLVLTAAERDGRSADLAYLDLLLTAVDNIAVVKGDGDGERRIRIDEGAENELKNNAVTVHIAVIHPQYLLSHLDAAVKVCISDIEKFEFRIIIYKRHSERRDTGIILYGYRYHYRLSLSACGISEVNIHSVAVGGMDWQESQQHYQRREQRSEPQGYAISCFFHNNVLRFFI